MAGQFRRRAAIGVDLLRKGRREQGLRGLSGELINNDFRHILRRPRQRLAGSRAPSPHQSQTNRSRLTVPSV